MALLEKGRCLSEGAAGEIKAPIKHQKAPKTKINTGFREISLNKADSGTDGSFLCV
jgi:hypothetical protein